MGSTSLAEEKKHGRTRGKVGRSGEKKRIKEEEKKREERGQKRRESRREKEGGVPYYIFLKE